MQASEALELTKQNWAENEQKYLSYILNFQERVEAAAKQGKTSCPVCVCPGEAMDFVAYYFEQMGYWTDIRAASQTDVLITISWKNIPNMSRGYIETVKMDKFLAEIDN